MARIWYNHDTVLIFIFCENNPAEKIDISILSSANCVIKFLCSDLSQVDAGKLFLDTELANVLTAVMQNFATELDIGKWDFVRIALSSWVLTVSKNHQNFRTNNVRTTL